MHKRSYSEASSVSSPYLSQLEEEQEIVYSELAAASVDPVELAGVPLMPQPQTQRKRGEWDETHQRSWEEQRFGRSLDGGAYNRHDREEEEEDAMEWRDEAMGGGNRV